MRVVSGLERWYVNGTVHVLVGSGGVAPIELALSPHIDLSWVVSQLLPDAVESR